ncbi:DUF6113 family protein [Actinopolymorpha rutila]|uniref:Uncharacterized protein n=1 Tax=Actinopolymorpha rutila TaxID=446787 RepID=A0A852Z947_9ACTN|nr:hypothetical protein [Actinopolymorpha rutila]
MTALSRAAGLVAAAVLGLVAGTCGVVVSRANLTVLGVRLPYGIVLALVVAALLFAQCRLLFGKGGGVAAALGWAVPVVAALWPRPEGDVVLAGDWYGLGFVVAGLFLVGWQVLRRGDRRARTGQGGPRSTGTTGGSTRRGDRDS